VGPLVADRGALAGVGHMAGDAVAVLWCILDRCMASNRVGADVGMTAEAEVVAGAAGTEAITAAVGGVAVEAADSGPIMAGGLPFRKNKFGPGEPRMGRGSPPGAD